MTVTSIVQKLLEQRHITAEEALALLKAEVRTTQCCPAVLSNLYHSYTPPPQPSNLQPGIWYSTPNGTGGSQPTLNDNCTNK